MASWSPDQHVTDPAARAPLPLGSQPRHPAVHHPDRALEGARLVADPAPAREHDPKEGDDHDQIDTEHGQQRDNHAAMLASREGRGITCIR